MQRLKILFYTPYYDPAMDHRLTKIIKDFPSEHYKLVILHFNSISSPGIEVNTNLNVHNFKDISDYHSYNIRKVLKQEEPDIILTITFMHLIDRVFLGLSKEFNIPLLIIQHGNITIEQKKTLKKNFSKTITGFRKYYKFINLYIKSFGILLNFERIKYLIGLIRRPLRNIQFYSYSSDYNAACIAIFGSYYKNFLCSIGFSDSNLFCLGTPKVSNIEEFSNKYTNVKLVLYISGGLAVDDLYGWSAEIERKILEMLVNSCERIGANLVYRPHPLQDEQTTKKIIFDKNIFISLNDSLSNLIKNSDVIVGECSNALHEAIVQYKPIIIIKHDPSVNYRFDYLDYGIGKQCGLDDLSDTVILFNEKVKVEKETYDKFISEFIGFINPNYSKDIWELMMKRIIKSPQK